MRFDFKNEVYIMGILNVTPDSFSDGGRFEKKEIILEQVQKMISDGADIIDIGGESTRPGHQPLGESEEIDRVIPIVESVRKQFPNLPISIDTYKSRVGELAIQAGATILNDVWGFKRDPKLAEVAAKHQVFCILMHNRENREYTHLLSDMMVDLKGSIEIALAAGVSKEMIILDPGIGFAKDYAQNLTVMNHLESLQILGYPLLLGASRKGFIGLTLDLPVEERVEGTVATTVMGILKGASIIRVHDVLENKRAAMMTSRILKG